MNTLVPMPFTNLYTTDQVRELEAICIKELHILGYTLMQRAGNAAFALLKRTWPNVKSIAVVCGNGNNGGDGLVVALLAHQAGLQVNVLYMPGFEKMHDAALSAKNACDAADVTMIPFTEDMSLNKYEVIIDSLLGMGMHGEVKESYQQVINAINSSQAQVFALDVPSGINCDTGQIMGTAVKADITLTFIAPKRGLFTASALDYCGKIYCDDLQIPAEAFTKIQSNAELLQYQELMQALPQRQRDSNKGKYGHVLVIGGDYGMPGAVRMAAEAALRVGAGLVTVATHPEHVATVTSTRPELLCYGINTEEELSELINKATVIAIGPGLGQSTWSKMLLSAILKSELPIVIDADALNLISKKACAEPGSQRASEDRLAQGCASRSQEQFRLQKPSGNPAPHIHYQNLNWVLTPHPGEAARLLDVKTTAIQQDRFAACEALQQKFGGTVVLKGAGTLVCSEDGIIGVCQEGNPGMASAGMGDVLTGIIAGLVAQGLTPAVAARLGVCIHALAGDEASKNGERGILALDLLPFLCKLVNP